MEATPRTHNDVLQGFVLHLLAGPPAIAFSFEELSEGLGDVFQISPELGDGLRVVLRGLVEAGLAKENRGRWSATSAAILAHKIYGDI